MKLKEAQINRTTHAQRANVGRAALVLMHQSIPAAPIPPPRATAGHLRALPVPGVGH